MKKRHPRPWSEEEKRLLRDNWVLEGSAPLALELGRSVNQVSSMANKMGLRQRKPKNRRVCLICDREFMSEGIFNRVCPSCSESPLRPVCDEYSVSNV